MYWNIVNWWFSWDFKRLIETWDVLKSALAHTDRDRNNGLIETWDVLKYMFRDYPHELTPGLIETWDVLK